MLTPARLRVGEVVGTLIVIWTLYYWGHLYNLGTFGTPDTLSILDQETQNRDLPSTTTQTHIAPLPTNPTISPLDVELFLSAASNTHLTGPFDPAPLTALCANTTFHSNLTMRIHNVRGGIGNIRNELLYFLRFAIGTGAGAIVIPRIHHRSKTDLSELESKSTSELSYLFDRLAILRNMEEACPQIKIFETVADLNKSGNVKEIQLVTPEWLPWWKPDKSALSLFQEWLAKRLYKGINETAWNRTLEPVPLKPVTLVPFDASLGRYPICADPLPLATTFSTLLPLSVPLRRLSALVLFALSRQLKAGFYPEINPALAFTPQTFLGAHLRADPDAAALHWTSLASQTNTYLHIATEQDLSMIYLASGSTNSTTYFRERATQEGMQVWTKAELLYSLATEDKTVGEEVREMALNALRDLQDLSWDQQAIIDLLVLEKSAYFVGVAESSFSWNIGVSRRLRSKEVGLCEYWDLPPPPIFSSISSSSSAVATSTTATSTSTSETVVVTTTSTAAELTLTSSTEALAASSSSVVETSSSAAEAGAESTSEAPQATSVPDQVTEVSSASPPRITDLTYAPTASTPALMAAQSSTNPIGAPPPTPSEPSPSSDPTPASFPAPTINPPNTPQDLTPRFLPHHKRDFQSVLWPLVAPTPNPSSDGVKEVGYWNGGIVFWEVRGGRMVSQEEDLKVGSVWKDELSEVVGRKRPDFAEGLWP